MGSDSGTCPAGAGAFSAGSSSLDPQHVHDLLIRRLPHDLLRYLDSIPGSSTDIHCHRIRLAGRILLPEISSSASDWLREGLEEQPDHRSRVLYLARYARCQAQASRLCVAQYEACANSPIAPDAEVMHSCSSRRVTSVMLSPTRENLNDHISPATISCSRTQPHRHCNYSTGEGQVGPISQYKSTFSIQQELTNSGSSPRTPCARLSPTLKGLNDAIGEAQDMPIHQYRYTRSTYSVPPGCPFPKLLYPSELVSLITEVQPVVEEDVKRLFITTLNNSPEWRRNLLRSGPPHVPNKENLSKALCSPCGSRSRLSSAAREAVVPRPDAPGQQTGSVPAAPFGCAVFASSRYSWPGMARVLPEEQ